MSVSITFLGGPETGDAKENVWSGGPHNSSITFPVGKAMTVDLDSAKNKAQRAFYDHVIKKARNNRFFKVTSDAPEETRMGSVTGVDPPPRRKRGPNKPKAEAA